MKILHVIAQLPMKTGSGVYFTSVIDGLKEYKEVNQAAIYATTKDYSINFLEEKNLYEVEFESKNIPFSIVGMSDTMPYKNTLYSEMTEQMFEIWQKNFYKILKKAKKEFNPDIVITHHLWILSSMVCDIFYDKKIYGICHNTDIRQALKNKDIKEKYVTNLKQLKKIFALSNDVINEIEEIYGYDKKNIIDFGAGYNERIFYPLENYPKKEKIELIYAGKFSESKGFYEFIKSCNILQEKYDNISVDIIGNLTCENRAKIKELNLNIKNINIYNTVNQKELANILRKKDIFVLPSYFEGLGLIAVEALGSGVFVVSSEIKGLIEFLGEEINSSNVIEYVKLPKIYDTDKAVEEEKPEFVKRLVKKIELQIRRVKTKRKFDKEILSLLQKHSWKNKISELYTIIKNK